MAFHTFGPGLALDKITMRGLATVTARLEDAETGEVVQAFTMGDDPEAVLVTTNRYGYFGQFQVDESVRRLRLTFGGLTLEHTAWELLTEAAAEAAQAKADAELARIASELAAALVDAPADTVIKTLVAGETSQTRGALEAVFQKLLPLVTATTDGIMRKEDKARIDGATNTPTPGAMVKYSDSGQIQVAAPQLEGSAANKGYVDGLDDVPKLVYKSKLASDAPNTYPEGYSTGLFATDEDGWPGPGSFRQVVTFRPPGYAAGTVQWAYPYQRPDDPILFRFANSATLWSAVGWQEMATGAGIAAAVRTGPENMFLGQEAGASTVVEAIQGDAAFNGGYMNTFLGAESGKVNARGWKNVGIGTWALRDNVDGYNNVAIGDAAMERNIGGVGTASPGNTDPGSRNVGVGSYALRYNTTGFGNVGIGRNAAHTNVSGAYNTAVGTNAYSGQYSNGVGDEKTASSNTALGYNAAFFTNADKNTAVGAQALYSNTSGVENTVTGSGAGYGIETGTYNVVMGARALRQNPAGGSNTALGTGSMGNALSGSRNTSVGTSALAVPTGGSSNVAVGYGAGSTTPAGNNYTTSLGTEAKANHNKSVAIGYGTVTTREDQVAFGARILNVGVMAGAPAASAGTASLWVETVGGKGVLKVRFATGPIINIVTEP